MQMPSLRPLSTLRPWRILDGRRGSLTTAFPSAASVGASSTASTSASANVSWLNTTAATNTARSEASGEPYVELEREAVAMTAAEWYSGRVDDSIASSSSISASTAA